jgi:hypothetical protein
LRPLFQTGPHESVEGIIGLQHIASGRCGSKFNLRVYA